MNKIGRIVPLLFLLIGCGAKETPTYLDYSIVLKDYNGNCLSNVKASLFDVKTNKTITNEINTNEEGIVTFEHVPTGNYKVKLSDMPNMLNVRDAFVTGENTSLIAYPFIDTSDIAPEGGSLGDVGKQFHEFKNVVVNKENELSLAEELNTHEAVILNFWASYCIPCRSEMGFFQTFAETNDKVSLIALDIYDDYQYIYDNFLRWGWSFAAGCDTNLVYDWTGKSNIPLTLIIDRFGTIVQIHEEPFTSVDEMNNAVKPYLGSSYNPWKK